LIDLVKYGQKPVQACMQKKKGKLLAVAKVFKLNQNSRVVNEYRTMYANTQTHISKQYVHK